MLRDTFKLSGSVQAALLPTVFDAEACDLLHALSHLPDVVLLKFVLQLFLFSPAFVF